MLEKKYCSQEDYCLYSGGDKGLFRASLNYIKENVTKATGNHIKTKMSGQSMTEKYKLILKQSVYLA